MKLRLWHILFPAVVVLALSATHGLWHIDEMNSGWGRRTFMSWADPCLGVGMLVCHTAVVVLGEFVVVAWLAAWVAWLWRRSGM
jgi:hypothetical protein